MRQKYWLKRITVHKSPGFAQDTFPPVEELGEHLNVIWGPNAVGKSTLSRAMRSLIWGKPSYDGVEAEGVLRAPGTDWSLSLSQGKLKQTRLEDNQIIPLSGRNDELSDSYWFTLHELLQEDGRTTDAFLRQVRTSMQGGVDLDRACADAGGISSFSSGNIAQAKQVQLTSENLRQVLQKQGEQRDIQDRIERLQADLQHSTSLSASKALLEEARSLLELKELIENQEQQLALYSPSLEFLHKSSPVRLEELLAAQERLQEQVRSCLQERQGLQHRFASCAITEEQLEDREKPERITNLYDAHKDALDVLKHSEQEFVSAKATLQEWEDEHSWLAGEYTLKGYVDTLRTLAQGCEPLRCDVSARQVLLDELGEAEQVENQAKDLTLLEIRLSDWLERYWLVQGTPKARPLPPGRKRWLLLLLLGIAAASSLVGIAVHPMLHMLGYLFMLLGVFLLLPSTAENIDGTKAEEALAQAELELTKLLSQLNREIPPVWTPESCHRMVEELRYEIANTHRVEQLNQRRKLAQEHLAQAKEKLYRWTLDWQEAAKAIGLKGDEGDLQGAQFFHFADRLQTWSDLRLAFVDAQEALSIAQKESAHALSLLQGELASGESDLSTLKAKRDNIIKRMHEARSLQSSLAENEERLLAFQEQLRSSEEAITEFWENIHLEFGNTAELRVLVAQLDQWNTLKYSLDYNRRMYEKKSTEVPEALRLATRSTLTDLSDSLDKVVRKLQALDEKREELGGLRSTFEALKFGSDLSQAQKEAHAALAELDALRSEQVMARMVASLAGELKRESEQQFQPQVLSYASKWLSSITNHRYTLSANNEGFFATDTIMAKTYKLDELSSGTRIQLLFAIRMAFITLQENTSGVALPIFLDELLANSDDERATAIVEAIAEIAKERQVFYMTAQRDEVQRLQTLAQSEVKVLALEDLRREFRVSKVPLKRYVHAKQEVPPAVEDYQGYARVLSVEGASLWGTIEALHSWHLLANSAELYGYLVQGLKHIGQLVAAKSHERPNLALRLQVLKGAQRKAQQGRSRTVHLSDLDDPSLDLNRGAKFWTQIQEVVGEQGCTGEELLEAVEQKRIQRFTDANQEVLATWLFENRFASQMPSKGWQAIMEDLFVDFAALTVGSEEQRVVERYLDAVIGEKHPSME